MSEVIYIGGTSISSHLEPPIHTQSTREQQGSKKQDCKVENQTEKPTHQQKGVLNAQVGVVHDGVEPLDREVQLSSDTSTRPNL